MRKRLMLFCVVAMGAGLVMWTCSKKSNPSGPGGGDNGGGNTQTLTYYVSGTDIIATFPQEITAYSYCNGNSLVTENDTSYEYISTMPYSISGNTLTLIQSTDTAYYDRSGTGSGLTGTWVVVSAPYGWPSQLDVTATTIVATFSGPNSCYADDFMSFDWAYDSIGFNGTAQKISCSQVKVIGKTTGDTVTITWNDNGDMTYTSAGHAAYTYYENPTSCPDDYSPSWYYTFLGQNNTGTPKRAVRPSIPRVKKHPVRW